MRFHLMTQLKSVLPLILVPTLLTARAAQTSTNSLPPMPKDPAAIMALAAQVNGLDSPDLKPWHLKVTYQIFNENSQPKDTGTYEEWWAGPTKYKATYASSGFTQTTYSTASGYFQDGDQRPPSVAEQMFVSDILHPLPSLPPVENLSFDESEMHVGNITLNCISARPKRSPSSPLMNSYCFAEDLPAIRITASGPYQSIYNSNELFQQHYTARRIHITNNQKPLVDASVDLLEVEEQVSDADLTPPVDAVHVSRKIHVSNGVMNANLLTKTQPIYPADAQQARIQGTVVLQAAISSSGSIQYLRVISGPSVLQQAAMDAVKTWRYKPYLLNGEPVEVETQINVVFSLSR